MAFQTQEVWSAPNVVAAIRDASEEVGKFKAEEFSKFLVHGGPHMSKSESPIEAVFWIWWQAVAAANNEEAMAILAPQYHVSIPGGTYRLDAAVPETKIAIELDGHEFHERTKEQVAYRNRRDRDLQAAGWTVLHFSGSELLRNPIAAVREVFRCHMGRKPVSREVHVAMPPPEVDPENTSLLAAYLSTLKNVKKFFYGTVIAQAVKTDIVECEDSVSVCFSFKPGHEPLRNQVEISKPWLEEMLSMVAKKPAAILSQQLQS